MNCRILHESNRRMRVRMAQKRMSVKEADLLQYYLEGFDFIRKAVVYERTCDVAIYYKDNTRILNLYLNHYLLAPNENQSTECTFQF